MSFYIGTMWNLIIYLQYNNEELLVTITCITTSTTTMMMKMVMTTMMLFFDILLLPKPISYFGDFLVNAWNNSDLDRNPIERIQGHNE